MPTDLRPSTAKHKLMPSYVEVIDLIERTRLLYRSIIDGKGSNSRLPSMYGLQQLCPIRVTIELAFHQHM